MASVLHLPGSEAGDEVVADSGVKVQVKGLAQLRRAFLQIEGNEKGAFKAAFTPIAEQVAGQVRSKVPHVSGRAAGSVQARPTDRGAKIVAGGREAPYYHFLDFGGSTGKGHRHGVSFSGSVKRPFIKKGRYLFPTLEEARDEVGEAAGDAIMELARKAGFQVRG